MQTISEPPGESHSFSAETFNDRLKGPAARRMDNMVKFMLPRLLALDALQLGVLGLVPWVWQADGEQRGQPTSAEPETVQLPRWGGAIGLDGP